MSAGKLMRVTSCATLTIAAAAPALSDPITTGAISSYWNTFGPNTIGIQAGTGIAVEVANVQPNLTTTATATNPAVAQPLTLSNLFTSPFGFVNTGYASTRFGVSTSVTQPWTVTLQNRSDLLVGSTNSLVGTMPLPVLAAAPTVSGSATAPTVSWDTSGVTVPFTRIRFWVYDDRSNRIVYTSPSLPSTATSFSVAPGVLAPNTNYTFRVLLEDVQGGLVRNRASTFVNHQSTSPGTMINGTAEVTYPGSPNVPLALSAGLNSFPDRNIGIGSASTAGALRIGSGTSLSASYVNVGPSGMGTMIVDGTNVTLHGTSDPAFPPANGGFLNVGRTSGSRGYTDVLNGGKVELNGTGLLPNPGMYIGRDAGSFGNVDVSGAGSEIRVTGPGGVINVGRSGDGRLNITAGGAVINDPNGVTSVGALSTARGTVLVSGSGSVFDAGAVLNVGMSGQGAVTVRDSGLVRALTTQLGPNGFIEGCAGGTLQTNMFVMGGILSPGCSPGTLTIDGDLVLTEGLLLLEAFGVGAIDRLIVTGNMSIGANARIDILLGFAPDSPLSFLEVLGTLTIDPIFSGPSVFALVGSEAIAGSQIAVLLGETRYIVDVQGVPTVGTLALIAIGFIGLQAARPSRRRAPSVVRHG